MSDNELCFPSFPVATVPVVGAGDFPVRRIYCVGRNYAAHAREMGFDPDREEPFFFLKPGDTIEQSGAILSYPSMTSDYHHEVELVVAIGKDGSNVPVNEAASLIFGYAVGLDMTRRDLQVAARERGRPWETGKAFDHSAPCGPITLKANAPGIESASISLSVNGGLRQKSPLSLMIWSPEEIIHWLSRYFDLAAGDLIFTGTPEGVAAVTSGDALHATVDGLEDLRVSIR